MKLNIITLFPAMVKDALSFGVIGKAIEHGLLTLNCVNPRDFAANKHNRVDDKPFGGGPGMVMMYDPMQRAMESVKQQGNMGEVVFLSPQGKQLDQSLCNELATKSCLTLVCGRYEGIDQRFVDEYVDQEISIGDYVISGGEIAACVVIDAIGRQIKGVLGDDESAMTDSFMNGLLGIPQYTRSDLLGQSGVPEVLLSGHHQAISAWREQQATAITKLKRPDLLAGTSESK
ncbi:tRNA (guanine(37)-N(1))-methyltransferase [hydrothermal vent metagenome]|uniref:tRNA (guanine-N(1)-)-methyltransferase n=1 Tax=hydrothermal vent metagenome TaxID=652676 RepID=A0A3B0WRN0_9ZZZZ